MFNPLASIKCLTWGDSYLLWVERRNAEHKPLPEEADHTGEEDILHLLSGRYQNATKSGERSLD